MVFALSTGNQIALAAVGATFIAFALASSFLFPRLDPNFPGRRLGLFVFVVILFFVAMMSAVLVFGKEKKKAEAATAPAATGAVQGDPVAGKQIFLTAGCKACHTLKAAGATGTVGPNLDQKKPPYALIIERVTNGKPPMPSFKGQLSDKQIQDVAAFVYQATHAG